MKTYSMVESWIGLGWDVLMLDDLSCVNVRMAKAETKEYAEQIVRALNVCEAERVNLHT